MIRLVGPALTLLLMAGCGPSNLEECRAEAATMPTDRGVMIAVADCHKKFGFDPTTARPLQ